MTAPRKSRGTKTSHKSTEPRKRKLSPEAQARAKERKAAARAKEKEAKAARKAKILLKAKEMKAKEKAKKDTRKATENARAAKHAHAKAIAEAWHESQALRAKFKQSPTIQNERAKHVAIEKHRLMLKENMSRGAAGQKARSKHPLSDMREVIAHHEDSKEFEKLLAAAREIDKELPGQDRAKKADELIATLRGRNNEIMRDVVLGSPKGSYVDEVKQRYKGAGHHQHRHHGHGHHHRHHGHGHGHHGHGHGHGHHGHGHRGHGHHH